MSDFVTKGEEYLALTQSLLEGRKMARSLENLADSLSPLCTDKEVTDTLASIAETAQNIAASLQEIYRRNAREAFGGESEQRPRVVGTISRRPVERPMAEVQSGSEGGNPPTASDGAEAGPAPAGGQG